MKPNLFPKMTAMQVVDREGSSQVLDVKLLCHAEVIGVFMADRTPGLLARNAATYIPQLLDRLQLQPQTTRFYRHVYLPQQGSLFGRFDIVWRDRDLLSYHFSMLNNLDEGSRLWEWINGASSVAISYAQTRNLQPVGN